MRQAVIRAALIVVAWVLGVYALFWAWLRWFETA